MGACEMINPQPPTPTISPARVGQSLPLDTAWDWSWSDGFMPEVARILTLCSLSFFQFRIANAEDDLKRATDLTINIISTQQIAIAVRLRRPHYQYRDLTIRAARSFGTTTELAKIKNGAGDFYLYGWTEGFHIREWMLVNLNKLRTSGLLVKPRHVFTNKDQSTGFIAIPYTELRDAGCIERSTIGRR